MIAVAKLADYLGMDMWKVQTKYQSTIKTAIGYLITLDPGQEDSRAALPIVAAAIAAYGDDENRTYRKFLEAGGADDSDSDEGSSRDRGKGGKKATKKTYPYKKKSWWFYQQLGALKHGHGQKQRREVEEEHVDSGYFLPMANQDVLGATPLTDDVNAPSQPPTESLESDSTTPEATSNLDQRPDYWDSAYISHLSTFHPERPGPFVLTDAVELDEGIYVFWEDIRHLYDDPSRKKRSVWARW
jgi:hypothetical protein